MQVIIFKIFLKIIFDAYIEILVNVLGGVKYYQ